MLIGSYVAISNSTLNIEILHLVDPLPVNEPFE